ncbi:hypothetical protein [Robbsia andropogonis]|uniref:hypothetical protein n=1 Tax=Robbsia andropogonis TaxID=28092 RepID=UPI0004633A93|nr:hypothetical protein [Robbsia andropogonis]MCP1120566.1 hypothetical protein [Robbsia andropogonis]MCP1130527.1 hypothetical protein [Robbsia andropogonis]
MAEMSVSPDGIAIGVDAHWDLRGITDIGKLAESARRTDLIEQGFSPLWRSAVAILSTLPLIGGSEHVKQAAADIAFSDTARAAHFDAFVDALQSQYGEAVTNEAIAPGWPPDC